MAKGWKLKLGRGYFPFLNAKFSFIHRLLADAESMLAERLLFRRDGTLPPLDLHSYSDNPRNREAGHYFALDDSDAMKKAQARMMKGLRNSAHCRKMMENSGDDLGFNPAVVKSYEEWDVNFRRLLLVLLSLSMPYCPYTLWGHVNLVDPVDHFIWGEKDRPFVCPQRF